MSNSGFCGFIAGRRFSRTAFILSRQEFYGGKLITMMEVLGDDGRIIIGGLEETNFELFIYTLNFS